MNCFAKELASKAALVSTLALVAAYRAGVSLAEPRPPILVIHSKSNSFGGCALTTSVASCLQCKGLPAEKIGAAGGRRSGMYARVTTLEGSPDRMDDAIRNVREQVLPQLQQMDGFKGFVALGDRQSGKLLGVAFWESEEVLRATEEAVAGVRSGAAEAAGGSVAGVEQYEVHVFEVSN